MTKQTQADGAAKRGAHADAGRIAAMNAAQHRGHRDSVDPVAPIVETDAAQGAAQRRGRSDSVDPVDSFGGVWPEIDPIQAVKAPPFPVEALPPVVASWVASIAHSTQTPPDLAAFVALAVVAAAGAHRIEVSPKPGWREPVNLFVVAALQSGSRKSAVFQAGTKPLVVFEREQATAAAPLIAEQATARRILEQQLKAAEAAAANPRGDKAARDQALADATDLARRLAATPTPTAPRMIVDDATPEKIAMLLADNGERIAVLSAEGGIFGIIAGRYSDGAVNADVFLKAHAGDDLRVDRVMRGPVVLSRPALTMGLAVQPSVMHGVLAVQDFRGRGLPARFLYAVPRSTIGHRDIDAPDVDPATVIAYEGAVRSILQQPMPAEPALVSFAPDAWATFREWAAAHERALGEGGALELLRDWGSKLPGALARIAGLFYLVGGDDDGVITRDHVTRALALAPYLVAHARLAHSVVDADPSTSAALAVLGHIKRNEIASFTKREIHRAMSSRFERADDLDAPLRLLVEHGHVRRVDEAVRSGPGRKPSPAFVVHPQARKAA